MNPRKTSTYSYEQCYFYYMIHANMWPKDVFFSSEHCILLRENMTDYTCLIYFLNFLKHNIF